MDDTIKILNSTVKSKESVAENTLLNIDLNQDFNVLEEFSVFATLDQYEQYVTERDSCTQYRLINTITPVISNVLFNPRTIILNSDYAYNGVYPTFPYGKRIIDSQGLNNTPLTALIYNPYNNPGTTVIDKTPQPPPNQPLEYLLGYDCFDNITFRTDTFKLSRCMDDLSPIYNPTNYKQEVGNGVFTYILDDIKTFEKGIRDNITELNGWICTTNNMKVNVDNRLFRNTNDSKPFIQAKKNCDTIDMFPNRESLLFTPFSNKVYIKDSTGANTTTTVEYRDEDNWKFYITYPYESVYDHFLVTRDIAKKETNGIPIMYAEIVEPNSGDNIFPYEVLKFTTAYKNGLKVEDRVRIRSNSITTYHEYLILKTIDEYSFFTLNPRQITNIRTSYQSSRLRRVNKNGDECEYYLRKFRKLPNWKFEKTNVTADNIHNKLEDNETNYIDFTKTLYRLSFAKNIFSDDIAQLTYKDSLDIKHLVDNHGRPLTELYLTIIKNNEDDKVYNPTLTQSADIYTTKYNRYFGNTMSGFELQPLRSDNLQIANGDYTLYKEEYNNIYYLHNLERNGTTSNYTLSTSTVPFQITTIAPTSTHSTPDQPSEKQYPISPNSVDGYYQINGKQCSNIDNEDNIFLYGDICEFSLSEYKETVLTECRYRFNTVNRESFYDTDRVMIFHHILFDDEDRGYKNDSDVNVTQVTQFYNPLNGGGSRNGGAYPVTADVPEQETELYTYNQCQGFAKDIQFIYRGYLSVGPRPEGYLYKPHYKLPLKYYSNVISQKSFATIRITQLIEETITSQTNLNILSFITKYRHNLLNNSLIRIQIKDSIPFYDKCFIVLLTSKDPFKFSITPYDEDYNTLSQFVNNITDINVIHYDWDTPTYAKQLEDGSYIWREILENGESDDVNGESNPELIFTNGHYYLHNNMRFYLKRQGGELYYDQFPSDLGMEEYSIENEVYNKENIIC